MSECTEEKFLRDVAEHKMTILNEDGVYRRIKFAKPGTSDMSFELITWPGHLCYTGDMGTYVFQRLEDMFNFFRTDRKAPRNCSAPDIGKLFINTSYWGEKCVSVDSVDGIRHYSPDQFREVIKGWLEEQLDGEESEELKAALTSAVEEDLLYYAEEGEDEVRRQVDRFEFDWEGEKISISDFGETTLTVKTFRFIWCCYALAWGIQMYDDAKAYDAQLDAGDTEEPVAAAREVEQ